MPRPEELPSFIFKRFHDLGGAGRIFLEQAIVDVGAVGVVVHGQHFLGLALVMQGAGAIHDQIDHGACLGVIQIFLDQFGAASRIDQMVKTDARDFQGFDQIEEVRNLGGIALVDGEPESPP